MSDGNGLPIGIIEYLEAVVILTDDEMDEILDEFTIEELNDPDTSKAIANKIIAKSREKKRSLSEAANNEQN